VYNFLAITTLNINIESVRSVMPSGFFVVVFLAIYNLLRGRDKYILEVNTMIFKPP